MATKQREAKRSGPKDVVLKKVPARMAVRVGAIAKLTRTTEDEVWERVAGKVVDEEFDRVVNAEQRKN